MALHLPITLSHCTAFIVVGHLPHKFASLFPSSRPKYLLPTPTAQVVLYGCNKSELQEEYCGSPLCLNKFLYLLLFQPRKKCVISLETSNSISLLLLFSVCVCVLLSYMLPCFTWIMAYSLIIISASSSVVP